MKLIEQLVKFGGIGGFLALCSISIYYIAFEYWSLPLYPVYIIVYCLGVLTSYMLNSKYTFKQETSKSGLAKYYSVYAIGLSIGIGLIFLGQMYTPWSDFYLTVASIVPRTLLVFIMTKIFIFKAV